MFNQWNRSRVCTYASPHQIIITALKSMPIAIGSRTGSIMIFLTLNTHEPAPEIYSCMYVRTYVFVVVGGDDILRSSAVFTPSCYHGGYGLLIYKYCLGSLIRPNRLIIHYTKIKVWIELKYHNIKMIQLKYYDSIKKQIKFTFHNQTL
jgi:hypothetical protein